MKTVAQPRALEHLIARLGHLEPATPRRWGTLSAGEMLCHLGDASASVLARPGGVVQGRPPWVKWVALYAPIRWPHGLTTPSGVDPRREGTRPQEFEQDRQRAVSGLREMARAPATAFPSGHGRFGHMTQRDWQCWAYRHTDHHLRQFGL